jgi:hypothetical protein
LDIEWVLDKRGRVDAPVLVGFAMAILAAPLLAVQLRCQAQEMSGSPDERRLQLRMSAQAARELAAALFAASQLLDDSPEVGHLN